ncbi:ABC transporter ATP-binding protein [Bradyrhizobium elkanii]|uniref:Branched-chain amino acid transport system ATP-binding protein n=1 Tax=Bradyrhizobium elkanii TaxID=29448 RepID=A0A8I2C616_BRAEL|nr:ABC transporter ATP-binding protein [Bradyrhizobium elkanii]MBP1296409.1 branched-chain amino acid transport system ATP-binding protein [Bradyrhizobium elkanii]
MSKRFGAIQALQEVSLNIQPGEAVGLMGVNGAGKSTLLNCICGLMKPDSGAIELDGKDIVGVSPHRVSMMGVGRTFQVPRSFRGLTVLENLIVAPSREADREARADRAHEALKRVKLDRLASNYAWELSGGQQKLLELARLIMIWPNVVLFDEPFAGMHSDLCRMFIDELKEMLQQRVGILLVCHDPGTLYRLSSRIIVMHEGGILAEGSPDQIKADPKVVDAYLGTAH